MITKPPKIGTLPEQVEEKTGTKRLILPERRQAVELQVTPDTLSVDNALNDALQVLSIDIARYRHKVTKKGESLTLSESRVLQGNVKALLEMKREQREQERADDLSKLSETELFALAKKALDAAPRIPEAEIVDDENDAED